MSKTRHGVLDLNSMNHTRSLSDTVPSIHTHPFDLKPTFCTQSTQPMQGSRQSRDNKALTHTHRHTLSSQLHNHSDNSHMEYPCVIKTKHTDKTETHTHTHTQINSHAPFVSGRPALGAQWLFIEVNDTQVFITRSAKGLSLPTSPTLPSLRLIGNPDHEVTASSAMKTQRERLSKKISNHP